jgi:acyl-CoA thioesterase FadM
VSAEHTDEIGHLNNVQALEFLQRGRMDLYARCGIRTEQGVGRYGTVVVNLNVNFRKECFRGDRVRVLSRLVSHGTKSFCTAQEILRENGEVAVEALVTSVVLDMAERCTVPIPASFAACFPPVCSG